MQPERDTEDGSKEGVIVPTVHFLNVGEGDCSIIEHHSGRVSVIDICNGNATSQHDPPDALAKLCTALLALDAAKSGAGNYGMKNSLTDPITYLKGLGLSKSRRVFRFILTHPDMDHLDGFKRLCGEIGIVNFWDSGVQKTKPDFSGGQYEEDDWDHFVKVRGGKAGVHVVTPKAGSRFQFANQGEPQDQGDCLSIVSPNQELIIEATEADEPNDASYVLVYKTWGGSIIFPGDAHDRTWEYVLKHYEELVKDCAVLIAPHHGRKSDRSYEFLDTLNPGLSLFGCAESENLAYDAWIRRDLFHITNNQAGNVILEAVSSGINVYVENRTFAEKFRDFDPEELLNGCFYIGQVGQLECNDC